MVRVILANREDLVYMDAVPNVFPSPDGKGYVVRDTRGQPIAVIVNGPNLVGFEYN